MLNRRIDLAPIPLRLILGAGFMAHGFPKLFTAEGHTGFVSALQSMSVPAPEIMAWVVGLVEFLGGLMLIIGAFVAVVSILGIINMLGALFLVHLPNGFLFTNQPPGYEVNLLYIAGFVSLLILGAGTLSVDRLIGRLRDTRTTPLETRRETMVQTHPEEPIVPPKERMHPVEPLQSQEPVRRRETEHTRIEERERIE